MQIQIPPMGVVDNFLQAVGFLRLLGCYTCADFGLWHDRLRFGVSVRLKDVPGGNKNDRSSNRTQHLECWIDRVFLANSTQGHGRLRLYEVGQTNRRSTRVCTIGYRHIKSDAVTR